MKHSPISEKGAPLAGSAPRNRKAQASSHLNTPLRFIAQLGRARVARWTRNAVVRHVADVCNRMRVRLRGYCLTHPCATRLEFTAGGIACPVMVVR